jgi:ubiquinone/menaquinone biosynthesis C-methylase UbiE
MDPRLQRRVQRYGWDKAAAFYERFWSRQLAPAQKRLLELADLQPGEQVLELAAGTGLVTFPAAEAVGPAGRVVATDISDVMVRQLTSDAAARGLSQITAERTDAEALRWDAGAFDAVLCGLGLMYVVNPAACLAESYRVLKPGGRMVAAVWGARRNCGWAEIFPIVDRRVQSEVCPMFFQLGTGSVLAQTMTSAGFTHVTEDRLNTTLEYDSADEAVGAAFAGGPVALAYARFDEGTRESAHAEYLASIEPYRAGDGYRIPGEFVVVRGDRI